MPRILIVDDDKAVRTAIQVLLEYEGFEVVVVENGRSAIEAAAKASIDAAIVDIVMPGMDGLETIRGIRQMLPTVRIVAMSGGGRSGEGVLDRALGVGATVILDKPFTLQQVLAAADEALAQE